MTGGRVFKRPGDGAYVRVGQHEGVYALEFAFFDDRPHTQEESRLRLGLLAEALLFLRGKTGDKPAASAPWCDACRSNHAADCAYHHFHEPDGRCSCQGRLSATREELAAELLVWRTLSMARGVLLKPDRESAAVDKANEDIALAIEVLGVLGYGPDGQELE